MSSCNIHAGLIWLSARQLSSCAWALSVLQQQSHPLFHIIITQLLERPVAEFSQPALMQLHQVIPLHYVCTVLTVLHLAGCFYTWLSVYTCLCLSNTCLSVYTWLVVSTPGWLCLHLAVCLPLVACPRLAICLQSKWLYVVCVQFRCKHASMSDSVHKQVSA